MPDAPVDGPLYAIRLGSKTLYANDTYDLRAEFVRKIAALRRKKK